MKIKLIYLTCILFVINSHSQHSIKEWNLRGKVKSVKETAYSATEKFGELVKGSITKYDNDVFQPSDFGRGACSYIFQFDTKGNLILYQRFDENGSLKLSSRYSFDKLNRLIKDSEGNIYEYNNFNKVNTIIYPKTKRLQKYNDANQLIEIADYNFDGTLQQKYIFTYEQFPGKKIKTCKNYDSEGLLETTEVETITKKENRRVLYAGNIGGTIKKTIIKTYNEKGKVLKHILKSDELIFETKYEYDSAGVKLIKKGENHNVLSSTWEKFYDDNGDLVAYISKDRKSNEINTKYILKYEYDHKKNWIKKIVYVNGVVPKYVIEREIMYY